MGKAKEADKEELFRARCGRDLVEKLCHCPGEHCTLKMIVQNMNGYTVEQIKFLEVYKWDRGKKEHEKFTWEDATIEWADKGYAKVYHDLYDPSLDPLDLYDSVKAKTISLHPELREDFLY